jgi:K+-sensing histidine kinase KdpD
LRSFPLLGCAPAGLVAAVATGIAYDYFWTAPYYSLAIFNVNDILTVVLLVIVGAAIEQLSWWGGRQRAVAAQRLDYFTALRSAASPIPGEAPAPSLEAISNTVSTVLDADSCRLVLDEPCRDRAARRRQRHSSWASPGRCPIWATDRRHHRYPCSVR